MSILTVEAKSTMRANLELELNSRKEKLLAMCEAQVASLRSRLERRVNRIPMNKRSMNIMDLIDPKAAKQDVAPAKEPAISSKRTRPAARPAPARAAASRAAAAASAPVCHPATSTTQNVQASQHPQHDHAPESRQLSQPKQQQAPSHQSSQPRKQAATRGVKRSSNEMASDKENMAEQLSVPKKRAKLPVNRAAPAARNPRTNAAEPAPVRTTRAASRKLAAPEVLSPKSSNARTNSRTIAPARATRRAR
ncbi:hypothetical protein BCR34DRAFT_665543 [Clohesyomyces aquaticus]|uniref:Borealin N-terminal domain-containing protein n=1 Tax=Clohesyomyces aquaticus TaxID=1231657 RepID=A0A1Y1ZH21_9PLEO|nr:hypothetical protein BCR34DRAFT_665543 [Clohesyomyces aquaticus]